MKQVQELNKNVKNLNIEIETIKKITKWGNVGDGKPRKKVRSYRYRYTNRIHEMEENISNIEDAIQDINILGEEDKKYKKLLTWNIQVILGHNEKIKPKSNGIEEVEES